MSVVAGKMSHAVSPASSASTVACVAACGYLLGLALPLKPQVDLPLVFLVLLAAVAAVMGLSQARPVPALVVIPVLGFVAARLLSALVGGQASRSLQLLVPFLPALLLFYVLSEWVETRRQIVVIYGCLAVSAFVLASSVLVEASLSPASAADAWARGALSPALVVKNDVAIVAVVAPLALVGAWLRRGPLVLLAVGGYLAAMISVIVVVQSRTALVTAAVALVSFAALVRPRTLARRSRVPFLLVVSGPVIVFIMDACQGFQFIHKLVNDWQGGGRLALWAAALSMLGDAPLLGHGPGSYALHYRAYLDALQLPAWIGVESRATPWAHNLYLELLAEQGSLGLLAFLALSGSALVMVAGFARSRDEEIRGLGAAAGASFIAFLAAALIELSFVRVWVAITFFTLIGLLAALRRAERKG